MGMIQHAPVGEMIRMRFFEQASALFSRMSGRGRNRTATAGDAPTGDAGRRLAGGLAHDLNNILLVIQGYAEIAGIDEDAGPITRGHIQELRKALARAARLVDDLRLLGKGGPFDPREVDLNEAITRALPALKAEASEAVDVRFEPSQPPARALVDERHLERMLRALGCRARSAMPGGGMLTVRCAAGTVSGATITVLDTGASLSPGDRARLFEPYPADGPKGQGLGLAVAQAVVSRLGGTIQADAPTGRGTAIVIHLPGGASPGPGSPSGTGSASGSREPEGGALRRPAQEPSDTERAKPETSDAETRRPMLRGTRMILIADDDATTRALGARVLTQSGYKVLIARDGLEAVEVFTANRDSVALVVLDDVMPRLGGRAALKRIRAIAPQVPVLLACGYAWDLDGREQPGAESCELLPRPWLPRDLLRRVRAHVEPPV